MPGVGTRMAPTKDRNRPVCLDLTRLISRVGRGPMTGIDRVELAYLRHFAAGDRSFYCLVKSTDGVALLDKDGATALLARFEGRIAWGRRDLRSRVRRRQSPGLQAAMSDLRRLAVTWARPEALMGAFAALFPDEVTYIDVGQARFDPVIARSFRALPGSRLVFMLHDAIPLDFPQYQRRSSIKAFETRIGHVRELADLVIYPSNQSRLATEAHLGRMGRVPPAGVAPLGLDIAAPRPDELPPGLDATPPYFVTIGTIEPRKNHVLLLNLWDKLQQNGNPPQLFVIGSRGWENEEVFRRLDRKPPRVAELNDLSDGAVSALLKDAAALLFPSHAEGFGLPPAEAAALGVPVICSDLPVLREMLGDYPTYLPPTDAAAWESAVRQRAGRVDAVDSKQNTGKTPGLLPNWDSHFKIVSNLL